MVTVAHIVRKQMQNKPFIQECMNKELINYGALADYLKDDIEQELGQEVNPLTISMALRRMETEQQENTLNKIEINHQTDLSSKSHLVEYVVRKTETILDNINAFYRDIKVEEGDYFSFNQGMLNLVILTNERHMTRIEELLADEPIVSKRTGLGAIFMSIKGKCRDTPGFFYLLTRSLAFNNVNVLTLTNIDREVFFLFENRDLPRAHKVLYDLLEDNWK
ncbi:MAG: hypothetical protein NWF07_00720 [Candidatus Bathyarchaeota archaeon]|nr:hypothetical protein [Candidatus Bathyarchaeota archaeon]